MPNRTPLPHLLLALFLALAGAGCSEFHPQKQTLPITPTAGDSPDFRNGSGPAAASFADWSEWTQAEKEAANFIHSAPIFFHLDSFELTDGAKAVLRQKAERIKAFPQFRVVIAGHCDERGAKAHNFALGGKRATAAMRYLVSLGVPPEQLDTVSFGKSNPAAEGSGESVWSLNRRNDFNVLKR